MVDWRRGPALAVAAPLWLWGCAATVYPPRDVAEMSAILKRWISDDKEQQRVARELAELRDRVAQHGATERAAAAIVDRLPAEDGVRRAA